MKYIYVLNSPGFVVGSNLWENGAMTKKRQPKNAFTPEIRDRAIRMVIEQQSKHIFQRAAIESIAGKFGCSPQTLHS